MMSRPAHSTANSCRNGAAVCAGAAGQCHHDTDARRYPSIKKIAQARNAAADKMTAAADGNPLAATSRANVLGMETLILSDKA